MFVGGVLVFLLPESMLVLLVYVCYRGLVPDCERGISSLLKLSGVVFGHFLRADDKR